MDFVSVLRVVMSIFIVQAGPDLSGLSAYGGHSELRSAFVMCGCIYSVLSCFDDMWCSELECLCGLFCSFAGAIAGWKTALGRHLVHEPRRAAQQCTREAQGAGRHHGDEGAEVV